jgi:transcriptional regulator with XRE-family HTH domain
MRFIIGGDMPHPISQVQREALVQLGEKIKSFRVAKNLTLEEVANRIGKDRQSIHRLEKGSFNPSYVYLMEVCKGLDIELSQLFEK